MADDAPYPHLFSPVTVGSETLPNRILMPAMDLNYAEDGCVTGRLIEFYRRRAAGGPSLVFVGGCRISPEAADDDFIGLHEDRFVEGLARLASAIRVEGALPVAQLYHAGRYFRPGKSGLTPIAPSAVVSRLSGAMPRAMSKEDIADVTAAYVRAGERAMEAGFAGVEIIGSAGYLPAQFASPVTNLREDEYGGDLEARSGFGVEVIEAVRRSLPEGAILSYRMGVSDMVPGGIEDADALELAKRFAPAGLDLLSLTGGWHEAPVPMITMDVPRGAFLPRMRPFTEALEIPVAGANRINRPHVAEAALEGGDVKMVAIGRAFIADPEWGTKARRGRDASIIPCTACNERCLDAVFRGRAVGCALNPLTGFEKERSMPQARRSRRIAVVGAGPAGLNAALWLAGSGHRVAVYERAEEPGGLLRFAHRAPGKEELLTYLEYLVHAVREAGVAVLTSWKGDAPGSEPPNGVVLAPGRRPTSLQGEADPAHGLAHFSEALTWERAPEGPGVVIGGGETGVETALHLHRIGAEAAVVHRRAKLAADLGPSTRWVVLKHLKETGLPTVRGEVVRLDADACIVRNAEGQESAISAAWSVWCVQGEKLSIEDIPIPEAWRSVPIACVGEAWSDGRIADWVEEAYLLACRWASL